MEEHTITADYWTDLVRGGGEGGLVRGGGEGGLLRGGGEGLPETGEEHPDQVVRGGGQGGDERKQGGGLNTGLVCQQTRSLHTPHHLFSYW